MKRFHIRSHGSLSYRRRKSLTPSQFAIPEKRKYPIDTVRRARNALSRVSAHGSPEEKRRVCSAVSTHYPEIHSNYCKMH